jgi:NAD(P)-dependent dehydrogenase (short-subunit alcohol dehydrogenase family)
MAKQIILVTGGNNGIGLETCRLLANQPNIHVIMASRSLEKGEKALAEIQNSHPKGSISLVQLDVNSDASIEAAAKKVAAEHDHVDTLINNAGICLVETSRQAFRESFETNCISPAHVTQAFLPLLKKSQSARLIYVTSGLGSIGRKADRNSPQPPQSYLTYRMSKAALNMLAVVEAGEYAKDGIRVFPYCPGYVVSDLAGMRQFKIDTGVPTPEKSAKGLLAIHQGKQDDNVLKNLHADSVVDGAPFHPW